MSALLFSDEMSKIPCVTGHELTAVSITPTLDGKRRVSMGLTFLKLEVGNPATPDITEP